MAVPEVTAHSQRLTNGLAPAPETELCPDHDFERDDTMTLEQFQASRRAVQTSEFWSSPHFVYADGFAIEFVEGNWPPEARNAGAFCLTIGNEQTISNDLAALERELHAYAVGEGTWEAKALAFIKGA